MSETTVSMPISALIGDAIIAVPSTASVVEVAKMLTDADVGAVVVGDPPDLLGIISERDIVHVVAEGRSSESTTASDIATRELVRCDAESSVADVALEMLEHYVRHVVVLEGGRPIGIVSARDLLGVYSGDDMVDEENAGS